MNRAARRLKHKLISLPFKSLLNSPIRGMKLNKNQKQYTCICNSGWLSISGELPVAAFESHVQQMKGGQHVQSA